MSFFICTDKIALFRVHSFTHELIVFPLKYNEYLYGESIEIGSFVAFRIDEDIKRNMECERYIITEALALCLLKK